MPEGEEDDGLDGEELDDRVERTQHLSGGVVEQEQGVQRQRDAEVVDDRDVEIAARRAGRGTQGEYDENVAYIIVVYSCGEQDKGLVTKSKRCMLSELCRRRYMAG